MELLTVTSFNIELSLSGFLEDNPDGTLSKAKMLDMYSDVLSIAKANMFVDQREGYNKLGYEESFLTVPKTSSQLVFLTV